MINNVTKYYYKYIELSVQNGTFCLPLPSYSINHHEQIYQVDNSVHFHWIFPETTAFEIAPPLAPPPSCESCTFAQLMSSNENAKWTQPTIEMS